MAWVPSEQGRSRRDSPGRTERTSEIQRQMSDELQKVRSLSSPKQVGKEAFGGLEGGTVGAGTGTSTGSRGEFPVEAPVAVREAVEHVIHGDRRVDHYAWMRNKKDPRVIAYLEAENAYADTEMKATEQFQEKLYQEMLGRILQTDLSVPYSLRGYSYYTRTEEGKQYPIYCRKREISD